MSRAWINRLLFGLYTALMLVLLFGRTGYEPGLPYWEQLRWNAVPFRTIRLFARVLDAADPALVRQAVVNLAGNILLFLPLGYFLPAVFPARGKLWQVLLTAGAAVLLVELLQLFTLLGSGDIDDLILNLAGVVLGWCLFRLIQRKKK